MTRKFKRRRVRCSGCGQQVYDDNDHVDVDTHTWLCTKLPTDNAPATEAVTGASPADDFDEEDLFNPDPCLDCGRVHAGHHCV